MADPGAVLLLVLDLACALLAARVAVLGHRAATLTGGPQFRTFLAAFGLLSTAFFVRVVATLFELRGGGTVFLPLAGSRWPVGLLFFQLLTLAGLVVLTATYKRHEQPRGEGAMLALGGVLLALAPLQRELPTGPSGAGLQLPRAVFFALELGVIAILVYLLVHAWANTHAKAGRGPKLVTWGFGLLLASHLWLVLVPRQVFGSPSVLFDLLQLVAFVLFGSVTRLPGRMTR